MVHKITHKKGRTNGTHKKTRTLPQTQKKMNLAGRNHSLLNKKKISTQKYRKYTAKADLNGIHDQMGGNFIKDWWVNRNRRKVLKKLKKIFQTIKKHKNNLRRYIPRYKVEETKLGSLVKTRTEIVNYLIYRYQELVMFDKKKLYMLAMKSRNPPKEGDPDYYSSQTDALEAQRVKVDDMMKEHENRKKAQAKKIAKTRKSIDKTKAELAKKGLGAFRKAISAYRDNGELYEKVRLELADAQIFTGTENVKGKEIVSMKKERKRAKSYQKIFGGLQMSDADLKDAYDVYDSIFDYRAKLDIHVASYNDVSSQYNSQKESYDKIHPVLQRIFSKLVPDIVSRKLKLAPAKESLNKMIRNFRMGGPQFENTMVPRLVKAEASVNTMIDYQSSISKVVSDIRDYLFDVNPKGKNMSKMMEQAILVNETNQIITKATMKMLDDIQMHVNSAGGGQVQSGGGKGKSVILSLWKNASGGAGHSAVDAAIMATLSGAFATSGGGSAAFVVAGQPAPAATAATTAAATAATATTAAAPATFPKLERGTPLDNAKMSALLKAFLTVATNQKLQSYQATPSTSTGAPSVLAKLEKGTSIDNPKMKALLRAFLETAENQKLVTYAGVAAAAAAAVVAPAAAAATAAAPSEKMDKFIQDTMLVEMKKITNQIEVGGSLNNNLAAHDITMTNFTEFDATITVAKDFYKMISDDIDKYADQIQARSTKANLGTAGDFPYVTTEYNFPNIDLDDYPNETVLPTPVADEKIQILFEHITKRIRYLMKHLFQILTHVIDLGDDDKISKHWLDIVTRLAIVFKSFKIDDLEGNNLNKVLLLDGLKRQIDAVNFNVGTIQADDLIKPLYDEVKKICDEIKKYYAHLAVLCRKIITTKEESLTEQAARKDRIIVAVTEIKQIHDRMAKLKVKEADMNVKLKDQITDQLKKVNLGTLKNSYPVMKALYDAPHTGITWATPANILSGAPATINNASFKDATDNFFATFSDYAKFVAFLTLTTNYKLFIPTGESTGVGTGIAEHEFPNLVIPPSLTGLNASIVKNTALDLVVATTKFDSERATLFKDSAPAQQYLAGAIAGTTLIRSAILEDAVENDDIARDYETVLASAKQFEEKTGGEGGNLRDIIQRETTIISQYTDFINQIKASYIMVLDGCDPLLNDTLRNAMINTKLQTIIADIKGVEKKVGEQGVVTQKGFDDVAILINENKTQTSSLERSLAGLEQGQGLKLDNMATQLSGLASGTASLTNSAAVNALEIVALKTQLQANHAAHQQKMQTLETQLAATTAAATAAATAATAAATPTGSSGIDPQIQQMSQEMNQQLSTMQQQNESLLSTFEAKISALAESVPHVSQLSERVNDTRSKLLTSQDTFIQEQLEHQGDQGFGYDRYMPFDEINRRLAQAGAHYPPQMGFAPSQHIAADTQDFFAAMVDLSNAFEHELSAVASAAGGSRDTRKISQKRNRFARSRKHSQTRVMSLSQSGGAIDVVTLRGAIDRVRLKILEISMRGIEVASAEHIHFANFILVLEDNIQKITDLPDTEISDPDRNALLTDANQLIATIRDQVFVTHGLDPNYPVAAQGQMLAAPQGLARTTGELRGNVNPNEQYVAFVMMPEMTPLIVNALTKSNLPPAVVLGLNPGDPAPDVYEGPAHLGGPLNFQQQQQQMMMSSMPGMGAQSLINTAQGSMLAQYAQSGLMDEYKAKIKEIAGENFPIVISTLQNALSEIKTQIADLKQLNEELREIESIQGGMSDITSKIKMPDIKKAELFVVKEDRTRKSVVPIDQVLTSDYFRKVQQSTEQDLAKMYPKIGSEVIQKLMANPGSQITSQTPFAGSTIVDPIRVDQLMAQQQMSMMQNPGAMGSIFSPGQWPQIPGQAISGLPMGWPNQGQVDPRDMLALQHMTPLVQQAYQSQDEMERFLNGEYGRPFLDKHPNAIPVLTSHMGMEWLLNSERGQKWLAGKDGQKRMIDIINAIRSDTQRFGMEAPALAQKVVETVANYQKTAGIKGAIEQVGVSNLLASLQATQGLMKQPNISNPQAPFANLIK